MKKTRSTTKLQLSRDTVRLLSPADLAVPAGARPPTLQTIIFSCNPYTNCCLYSQEKTTC